MITKFIYPTLSLTQDLLRLLRYLESKEEEEALSELPVLPPPQSQLGKKNSKNKVSGKLEGTHPLE